MSTTFDIQTLCGRLDRMEITTQRFVEECTRLIAHAIGCTRAGIWLFIDGEQGPVLHCLGVYDRSTGQVTSVPDEAREQVDTYFGALEDAGHVMAEDVLTHPATAALYGQPGRTVDERSLLSAAFAINGHLFGAFTCSEVGRTKTWTNGHLALLRRIGGRASLALAGATKTRHATMPMPL